MYRRCSNCGRDLHDKPALEGLAGTLCFVCKFQIDNAGGEEYLAKVKEFPHLQAEWQKIFGTQWAEFQHRRKTADFFDAILGISWLGALAVFWLGGAKAGIIGVPIALAVGGIARWFTNRAEKIRCEPPPVAPTPQRGLLETKPRLVLDNSSPPVGAREYDNFDGYPPDWKERKTACLARDRYTCQLCGSPNNLHVHHVWPVSYSSNHTLQNLITLCRPCHMKQGYWDHRDLVKHNIRAKTKYYVRDYTRSDGVIVKGHSRKIGRRGNFWQAVKYARRQYRKYK